MQDLRVTREVGPQTGSLARTKPAEFAPELIPERAVASVGDSASPALEGQPIAVLAEMSGGRWWNEWFRVREASGVVPREFKALVPVGREFLV